MMTMAAATALTVIALVLGSGGTTSGSPTSLPAGNHETVFLIHGMARTPWSMMVLGARLTRAGYDVRYYGYPTPSSSLGTLSQELKEMISQTISGQPYHLVGHSLGNIIIRDGFRAEFPAGLGRVVMLAPPNQPALLALKLADNPLFQLATGEPGQRLGDPAFYDSLPIPTVPFGIIAGTKSYLPLFDQPNDGIVAVASTRLEGMEDWTTVDQTHTFLMNGANTFRQIYAFLENGQFVGSRDENAIAGRRL